jgi:hypothetical protein
MIPSNAEQTRRATRFYQAAGAITIICVAFVMTLVTLNYLYGELDQPWKSFAPRVASLRGSIESASATGSYHVTGTTVHFQVAITIGKNGTGIEGIRFALPVATKSVAVIIGRDASSGAALQGIIAPTVDAKAATLFTYSNGYPGGDGKVLFASGTYEGVF